MSTDDDLIDYSTTETAAAVEAGQRIGRPHQLGTRGRFYVTTNPLTGAATVHDVDALTYDEPAGPARKTGGYTLRTAESFVDYVTRHGRDGTEVYADVEQRAVLAIINGHLAGPYAGYQDHRATLKLRHTTAWNEWIKLNGKLLAQEPFAEHIETRQGEVIEPDGATLLEIASTFKATKTAEFESAKRLSDGQTVLAYRETVQSAAGKKGDLAIPETFTLALAPFEGTAPFKITARLRSRVQDGHLALGYILDRPDEVLEAAFAELLTQIKTGLDTYPVFTGWPTA